MSLSFGINDSYLITGAPVSLDGIGDNIADTGSSYKGADKGLTTEFTIAPSMDSAFASTVKEACGRKPLPGLGGNHGDKVAAYNRCVANFNDQQSRLVNQQVETEKILGAAASGTAEDPSTSRTSQESSSTNKMLIGIIAAVILLSIIGLIIYLVRSRKKSA